MASICKETMEGLAVSVQKQLEEVLHEAGYSGQIGSSWGGNSPVSSEVTMVQQKVRKEKKKERQHSWVLRKQQRVRGRRRDK